MKTGVSSVRWSRSQFVDRFKLNVTSSIVVESMTETSTEKNRDRTFVNQATRFNQTSRRARNIGAVDLKNLVADIYIGSAVD